MTPKFPTTWPSSVANRQGALSYALFERLQRVIFIQNGFFWSSCEIGNQKRRSEGKISHGEFKNPPKKSFQKRGGTEKQSGQMSVIMSVQEMLITSKVRSFFSLFSQNKGPDNIQARSDCSRRINAWSRILPNRSGGWPLCCRNQLW